MYDVAEGLRSAGLLSEEAFTQIWEALNLLDVTAADVGLDEWDFLPTPAPEGMRKAAVAAGALTQDIADLLSKDEIEAALENAWGPDGAVDPLRALHAAIAWNRSSNRRDVALILSNRQRPAAMRLAKSKTTLCPCGWAPRTPSSLLITRTASASGHDKTRPSHHGGGRGGFLVCYTCVISLAGISGGAGSRTPVR